VIGEERAGLQLAVVLEQNVHGMRAGGSLRNGDDAAVG
jgi:hypothetical protein